MSTIPASPEEAPIDVEATESQALKKLKEERAADAERIRQDFVRSQRANAELAAAAKQPPPEPDEDEL